MSKFFLGLILSFGISTNAYVNAVDIGSSSPIGTIIDFAGTACPFGFLDADGSAISRTTYALAFSVLSTTWGVGDGSTTFNLPNLQGYPAFGKDGSNAVGLTTGSNTVDISHTHDMTHTHAVDPPSTTTNTVTSPSQAVGILSLLSTATPAGWQHSHTLDIASFTSGASSAANTGTGGTTTLERRPARVYVLKCVKVTQ